jgi:hypothetical protein
MNVVKKAMKVAKNKKLKKAAKNTVKVISANLKNSKSPIDVVDDRNFIIFCQFLCRFFIILSVLGVVFFFIGNKLFTFSISANEGFED